MPVKRENNSKKYEKKGGKHRKLSNNEYIPAIVKKNYY